MRKFETVKDNESRILCGIYLTVNGALISPFVAEEYSEEDKAQNRISHVDSNILKDISVYNRSFPRCIEFNLIKDIYIDKEYRKHQLKWIADSLRKNHNDIENLNKVASSSLSSANEFYQYVRNKLDYDEITFIPTEQEIKTISAELMELHRKGARHYFYQKNHREPTEQ